MAEYKEISDYDSGLMDAVVLAITEIPNNPTASRFMVDTFVFERLCAKAKKDKKIPICAELRDLGKQENGLYRSEITVRSEPFSCPHTKINGICKNMIEFSRCWESTKATERWVKMLAGV